MANINNTYSLINEKQLSENKQYYNVKISNDNWFVIGQMKTPLQFQLNAEYADLIGSEIPHTEILKKLGDTTLTTGIFSQKYFSKGGHLELSLEFRVHEGEYQENEMNLYKQGISKVTKYASNLSNMVVADPGIQTVRGGAEYIVNKKDATIKTAIDIATSDNIPGALFNKLSGALHKRTVNVEVGTFLRCSAMVITSLNVTYSRELTEVGPLYGDFTVGVQSIQALHRGTDGSDSAFSVNNVLRSGQSIRRVKIISDADINTNKERSPEVGSIAQDRSKNRVR